MKARIGKTSFELVAGANAFFMKDAAEDAHVVDIMKRGGALIVEAIPAKGAPINRHLRADGLQASARSRSKGMPLILFWAIDRPETGPFGENERPKSLAAQRVGSSVSRYRAAAAL